MTDTGNNVGYPFYMHSKEIRRGRLFWPATSAPVESSSLHLSAHLHVIGPLFFLRFFLLFLPPAFSRSWAKQIMPVQIRLLTQISIGKSHDGRSSESIGPSVLEIIILRTRPLAVAHIQKKYNPRPREEI